MESVTWQAQRKKMPRASGGAYDGVFAAPAAEKRFKAPAAVDDYDEIFGGGGGGGCSIPVLDLSALDEAAERCRSSRLDYDNIFGGFHQDVAAPYEEVAMKCSDDRNHSDKDFSPQGADTCSVFGNCEERPSEASDPSLDAIKQFNMSYLKTSQGHKNQLNGTTHVAKLHAVPGFTYFVNEPPSKQKTESGMPMSPVKGDVHRTWSFSGNIADGKTEMLLPRKPNAESSSGAKGGSQSKDKSFNITESYQKSKSFETTTSNNPLESWGIRGHPKRSKSSNISLKANPFEKSTSSGTDGSSDEELDKNSAAAACAASLKRVLEKAQESIRMAKEIRERGEKDGIQRFSNLSSERSSKAKNNKKNRSDQETNNSNKQSVKDRHERLGSELDESNERSSRLGSKTTGVSTASECCQELLTSTAAEGKSQLNIAEVSGNSKQFLDLVDTRKSIASDSASKQVDMDKGITFLSMRKQENEASLSMRKQESVIAETIIAKSSEQKEKNIMIETSIENDFRMGNTENKVHVDEQTQVSEVTANSSDSAPTMHESTTSVSLEITEKYAESEDILDELRHCEITLPVCLDMRENTKPVPSEAEDQHMLNECHPTKQEEPNEGQVQAELQFTYSHSEEEKENELHSCNEGNTVQQEASGFVASDDAPEVCGSRSLERTHKDSQEGEACGTYGLDSCNEGGMVQQEACGFMESDDAPEVYDRESWERIHKNGQGVETFETSNTTQQIGIDNAKLISEHEEEENPTVPYEELKKKVVDYIDRNDKKLIHVPPEDKSTKVLNNEHWEGEDPNISEETYNQVKVDRDVFGEEFDWGEVEKSIKKSYSVEDTEVVRPEKYKISASLSDVAMVQETEETTGGCEENCNFNNDEEIGLLQKDAHENNFDTDAWRLHDVQEANNTGVFEDHEGSNSTTDTREEFYNCDWEENSEEIALKASNFTKLDEKSDFVQCPSEDQVSSSETSGPFMDFESDGKETNPDQNGLNHEHMLPQENVLEATTFVEDAEKDVNIKFKIEDLSEDQKATNIALSSDIQGTVTDKNVKEPETSVNPESGTDFLYKFRENAVHVNEEFSFDEEDEDVPKVEKKEKEINETESSAVTHQVTINQQSEEETTTGQNIQFQFVSSKPQKNALLEDNEARESSQKDLKEKELSKRIEAMKKEREREKDRIAVERAIREARQRAFAEARERAERAAVARAGAEVRERMIADAREKHEKANAGTKLADKASIEGKQRAERAAVERATAEARERALEKALSQKSTSQGRVQTNRLSGTPKESVLKQSSSDLERSDGSNSESAQRRKARLERHERIMERAAKALAEKNMRDLQAQKEQAERNRLAESVDADVKRWANGKEGNLRALLSTLQYILGPDSGWKPISLTEIVTMAAVKKAYRKATLYVHPDKLQQRGASIQQKYICEKVFDLLKAAWSKSNSEER